VRSMTHKRELEFRLWSQHGEKQITELPAVEQTASEEVGNGGVQQTQSGCSKIGLQER
jgi:hypothetical protein